MTFSHLGIAQGGGFPKPRAEAWFFSGISSGLLPLFNMDGWMVQVQTIRDSRANKRPPSPGPPSKPAKRNDQAIRCFLVPLLLSYSHFGVATSLISFAENKIALKGAYRFLITPRKTT